MQDFGISIFIKIERLNKEAMKQLNGILVAMLSYNIWINMYPIQTWTLQTRRLITLNEGADIKYIEAEYKDVMTLRRTNERPDSRFTTYHFDCHLNNSYEVLRLADELYKRNDVNWADADKYSPIYFDI